MTSWDDVCNTYRRLPRRGGQVDKAEYRNISSKIPQDLYRRMYGCAGKAGDTLSDWIADAIRQRVERDEASG